MTNFSYILSQSLLAVFSMIVLSTQAQRASPIYVQFDFVKAKTTDYEAAESEIWKPVYALQIQEKSMVFWGFYKVQYPGGNNKVYDYVIVRAFSHIDALEEGLTPNHHLLQKVHPQENPDSISKRIARSKDLVRSEVFEMIAHALPLNQDPGKFMMVNQMRVTPGREARYERMEKEIYLPAHKILIEEEMMVNWILLRRFAPLGTKYGYNYLTMDVYDHLAQATGPIPEEIWHAAHPSKDLTSFFIEIDVENMRELVNGEIWELIDHISPN